MESSLTNKSEIAAVERVTTKPSTERPVTREEIQRAWVNKEAKKAGGNADFVTARPPTQEEVKSIAQQKQRIYLSPKGSDSVDNRKNKEAYQAIITEFPEYSEVLPYARFKATEVTNEFKNGDVVDTYYRYRDGDCKVESLPSNLDDDLFNSSSDTWSGGGNNRSHGSDLYYITQSGDLVYINGEETIKTSLQQKGLGIKDIKSVAVNDRVGADTLYGEMCNSSLTVYK